MKVIRRIGKWALVGAVGLLAMWALRLYSDDQLNQDKERQAETVANAWCEVKDCTEEERPLVAQTMRAQGVWDTATELCRLVGCTGEEITQIVRLTGDPYRVLGDDR